jgi:hypothetical protein
MEFDNDPKVIVVHAPAKRAGLGKLLAGGAVLIAAIAVGVGVLLLAPLLSKSPVPAEIADKALFDVYYPSRLPAGYTIDQDSFQFVENDVLVFSAKKADGSGTIAFTEQAKPEDYDFNEFNKGLNKPQKLHSGDYTAILGQLGDNQPILSVTSDSTWVLVRSEARVSAQDYKTIAGGLKK